MLRRLLAGDDPERLAALGRDYAVGLHHLLRPEMAERVRWHRSEGHRLVIVSASLGYYLRPVGRRARLRPRHRRRDGARRRRPSARATCGQVNVRGPEKARRLTAWLDEQAWPGSTRAVGLRRLVGRRRAARHGRPRPLARQARRAQRLQPVWSRSARKRAPGGPTRETQGARMRHAAVRSLRLEAGPTVDADRLGVHVAVREQLDGEAGELGRRCRGASGTARPS